MNAVSTFTPAMYDAMRSINEGHVTAKDIGVDARVLNALCDRGFLLAERTASMTFYEPTAMGLGAIAVLNAPVVPRPSEGRVSRIQRTVANYYGIPDNEMVSARRARRVARPRQVAMWLARELTPFSLPDIGRRFGGRDHTTVIHAIRVIDFMRKVNADGLADDIEALLQALNPVELREAA